MTVAGSLCDEADHARDGDQSEGVSKQMLSRPYALHHMGRDRLLLLFNSIENAENVPFDTNTFRYESISEAADIDAALRGHLEQILRDAAEGKI